MDNKAVGVCFCSLAVVLFLARYLTAMLYRGFAPHAWGGEDLAENVGYVSLLPWVLAVIALVAGSAYLAQKEK